MTLMYTSVMACGKEKPILDGDEQWVERRRWTAEDINEIECLRAQGMTWKQIAQMYNTTKGNIFNVYNNHKKIELSH